MKYLLSALSILAILSLGLLVVPLLAPRPKVIEGSLIVNQRVFTPQELNDRLMTSSYHFDNDEEQLTNLIYRELLLQEAKTQGIDSEIKFLNSMRNFYEQSMIKTLLDRQYNLESHEPNDSQVAACQPFLTRRYEVTEIEYPDHDSAIKNINGNIEHYQLAYLEMPEDIRTALLNLTGTELSEPYHSGRGWLRIQLIGITAIPEQDLPSGLEQEELCRGELRRQSIQSWAESLYHKSNIEGPIVFNRGDKQ